MVCMPCLKTKSHSLKVLTTWLAHKRHSDPPLCLIADEVCICFVVFDDQEGAVHVTSCPQLYTHTLLIASLIRKHSYLVREYFK